MEVLVGEVDLDMDGFEVLDMDGFDQIDRSRGWFSE